MSKLYERAIDIFNKNVEPDIARGSVTPIPYQPTSTATTVAQLKEDFNAFLAKVAGSGRMADLFTYPEPGTETVLGKTVSDLQDGIEVLNGIKDNAIAGTLKYVTGYTGFSGDPDRQQGYYLVLHFVYDTTAYPKAVVELNVNDQGVPHSVELDSDKILVARIVNKDVQTLTVVLYDGDDAEAKRFKYRLSALTLEEPLK